MSTLVPQLTHPMSSQVGEPFARFSIPTEKVLEETDRYTAPLVEALEGFPSIEVIRRGCDSHPARPNHFCPVVEFRGSDPAAVQQIIETVDGQNLCRACYSTDWSPRWQIRVRSCKGGLAYTLGPTCPAPLVHPLSGPNTNLLSAMIQLERDTQALAQDLERKSRGELTNGERIRNEIEELTVAEAAA